MVRACSCFRLSGDSPPCLAFLELFAFRSDCAVCLNIENLIETETGKKFAAALAAMDDMEMPLA